MNFYYIFFFYFLFFSFRAELKAKTFILHKGVLKSIFNDPDINQQWYFKRANPNLYHFSHELDNLWAKNITGQGVNIGLIHGGIEQNHRDLKDNYDPNYSFNFLKRSNEIGEEYSEETMQTAGLISASANNNQCGVGAAPSSKFSILQIFEDENNIFDDAILSRAILHQNNIIDIYVLNWKYDYRMNMRLFPGPNTIFSMKLGSKVGRGGLGSIFISGSGNLRDSGENCAFNGILQRPEILIFGSITGIRLIASYSERCCAILAASLSSYDSTPNYKIYTTTSGNKCRNSTDKSQASTAISAGILALLLSYNPFLTYRQVILAVILSSIQLDGESVINEAGLLYSYSLGFGMLYAERLIEISKHDLVTLLLPEHICSTAVFSGKLDIKKNNLFRFYVYSSGCLNYINCVTEVEQVIVMFTILSFRRNSIRISLLSPRGTKFVIVEPRLFDTSRNGFHRWSLKIMGFYGENVQGVWILEVFSRIISVRLSYLHIIFHGTCINPNENIISHKKVQEYICNNNSEDISMPLMYRLCPTFRDIRVESFEHDYLSFTMQEYSNIEGLISIN